jgi:hypothetical protein
VDGRMAIVHLGPGRVKAILLSNVGARYHQ